MNATEYKAYHESLMQNNHGSTAFHTFLCIFFTVQCSLMSSILLARCDKTKYIYEYLLIVLPLILIHTTLSEYIYITNFILFLILLYQIAKFVYNKNFKKLFMKNNSYVNRINSITFMRGLTYLITVNCILAVDFKDFPRYLAKTERFGYSLMDTGVGLFVLMSGLVHKDLRNNRFIDIIKGNMKFVSVLMFLGVARFISVKQLDYQEHVTEYGVHWNFFFTLAICKILSTVILYYTSKALSSSLLVLFIHEFLLYYGLQDWVFSDALRDTLLSANREGVCSSLGYVSLYLFAAYVRQVLIDKTVQRYVIVCKLLLGAIFLWTITYTVNSLRSTSRTLANAGYCIYLEAVLLTVVALLYLIEILQEDEHKKSNFEVPLILMHVNTNGLLYFLVSNLLTGAINLTLRTLLVSSTVTFVILNTYMILTTTVMVYLNNKGLKCCIVFYLKLSNNLLIHKKINYNNIALLFKYKYR